jgi:predicted DNA-binding transcriptional regulator YafY
MRADRLVAILLLLQARGGMTAPELAEELECSPRTIYRDLDALSGAGVPVYAERGVNGGIRLLDGYKTDLTGLSPGEAEALFLMGIPGPLDELGLGSALEGAQRKVLAALPESRRPGAERISQRIYVDAAGWDRDPGQLPWLPIVARALWTDRKLQMLYVRADNRMVQRRVDPLGLVLKAGNWYLVATTGRYQTVYRVSRVRRADVVDDEPLKRPPDFDLASYWVTWLAEFESRREADTTEVHVLVSPEVAADMPRLFGEDVRLQVMHARPGEDGRCELKLTFSSMDEARLHLLGWGRAIEVVSPGQLRDELARAAREVMDLYGQNGRRTRPDR